MSPSSYPGDYDVLNNPLATDPMNSASVPHARLHTLINDAVEAIQQALGKNPAGSDGTVANRLSKMTRVGHKHAISDVNDLQAALESKSASGHSHSASDVTSVTGSGNLSNDLNNRPTHGTAAPKALGTAAVGVSTKASREDHVHPVPSASAVGAAAKTTKVSTGAGLLGGGDLSTDRTLSPDFATSGGDNGTSTKVSRGDHHHDGRYFTETESDARFATKSHNHDGVYARLVKQPVGTPLPDATTLPDGTLLAVYS